MPAYLPLLIFAFTSAPNSIRRLTISGPVGERRGFLSSALSCNVFLIGNPIIVYSGYTKDYPFFSLDIPWVLALIYTICTISVYRCAFHALFLLCCCSRAIVSWFNLISRVSWIQG